MLRPTLLMRMKPNSRSRHLAGRASSLAAQAAAAVLVAGAWGCGGSSDRPTGTTAPPPTGYLAGTSYFGRNDYVEYIAGELPVVILAPHGGTIRAADMPNRASPDTLRDTNTEELARAIDTAFVAVTGRHPHIVLCRVHRIKVDCNRTEHVGAGSDVEARQAWTEFHAFVGVARQAVLTATGRGLVVDLHGHGHAVPRLELGYLLEGDWLDLPDATLDAPAWRDSASVREVLWRTGQPLSAVLRGPGALGTRLAARGYPSVPSAQDPSPGGTPYFSGGYNILTYGSRAGGTLSAVQIEAHFAGVRDTPAARAAFARVLAEELRAYLAAWFAVSY